METLQDSIKSLPHAPGVYIFRDVQGTVIYVGKAKDLVKRVRQYFQGPSGLSEKTIRLTEEIASVETVQTTGEFDALLLEAKLVRMYMPRYNAALRDDKSPLYVVITASEDLPRVLQVRRTQLKYFEHHKKNAVYGPFPSAQAVRIVMRHIRRIIPYCTQKERNGRPCFYSHIGLCSPCPSVISRMEQGKRQQETKAYRANIRLLTAIFEGKSRRVSTEFIRRLETAVRNEQFEAAAEYKQKLDTFYELSTYRYDPAVYLDKGADDVYREQVEELLTALRNQYPEMVKLERIECFDISNIGGSSAVGSMVVLEHGRPGTDQYRRFRIRTVRGISDVGMMKEVLTRRLSHPEWPFPDFLLVDGGKGQVGAARDVLRATGLSIPIAGLAKRNEELVIPAGTGFAILRLPLYGKAIKVLQRVRDEAHRFALAYHRKLRNKAFLPTKAEPD